MSAALIPIDGLPSASKANVLFARSALRGNIMLMVVGSVCGACNALFKPSAFCCAKMVC
jgi:hypothetical protein